MIILVTFNNFLTTDTTFMFYDMAFSEQALSQLLLADTFYKIHTSKTLFENN